MNEAHKKAQATRERNQEARARRYEEQAANIRAARLALLRVMESEDATPRRNPGGGAAAGGVWEMSAAV